jgi:hypothetical protein
MMIELPQACSTLSIAIEGKPPLAARASARAASDSGCDVNSRAAGERRPVQIDDSYPIQPSRHNSVIWYVKAFYVEGFGRG